MLSATKHLGPRVRSFASLRMTIDNTNKIGPISGPIFIGVVMIAPAELLFV